MDCEFDPQLQAYHDGELDSPVRAAIESHLLACSGCQASLQQLRATSALFAALPRTRLSQIARRRLDDSVDAVMERSLVRFAWSLSGVAAAVLVAGSLWLMQANEPAAAPSFAITPAAPPWVEASISARSNRDVAVTPAAQWYLADASTRNDELP